MTGRVRHTKNKRRRKEIDEIGKDFANLLIHGESPVF
jgi:hypothetical protein